MNPLEFFSFRIRLAHALHDAEQQFGSAKAINARMHAEIAELRADYNEMNRCYIECEGKLTKSVIASTECARMLTQARGEIVRLKQELASAMQPRDAKGRFEKRGENA